MKITEPIYGLKIFSFDSGKDGKHILFFGAIHGDEYAGTNALNALIQKISNEEIILKSGIVTIIPVCNPKAYEQDVRQIDINLNRLFGAPNKNTTHYETEISNCLETYIGQCDYLLDLHSTHEKTDPAFLCAENETGEIFEFAKVLDVENIYLDWNKVYSQEDYCTEAYAIKCGKIAITLECGHHDRIDVAQKAIMNSLAYLGIIDGSITKSVTASNIYRFEQCYTRNDGDEFVKDWVNMSELKQDEPIYKKADASFFRAAKDCVIMFPNKKAIIGQEFFFLGRKD
tara:strand:+ start:713 stop:1570 length:858 start_codon:yes stop_codon:yes gene_type:complete